METNRSDNASNYGIPDASFFEQCFQYIFIVNTIVSGTLCALGMTGNCIAFYIFKKIGHRNSNTLLLQALASMDSFLLLFIILCYSMNICSMDSCNTGYYFVYSTIFIRPLVKAAHTATVWTSVLLGINRYIVVCRPLMAATQCTVDNARKQIAIVWLISLIYACPQFFEAEVINESSRDNTTVVSIATRPWARHYHYQVIYIDISSLVLAFIVPLVLQLMLSIRLSAALYTATRAHREMSGNMSDVDKQVTRLVLGVLIVFLICHTPVAINNLLWMVQGGILVCCGDYLFYYQQIALMFMVLNSALNCFIYIVLNATFRRTLLVDCLKMKHTAAIT